MVRTKAESLILSLTGLTWLSKGKWIGFRSIRTSSFI